MWRELNKYNFMSEKYPIVFDVETQYSFDEVGGRDQFDKLKVSVVGI